jgi:hypothetical protein
MALEPKLAILMKQILVWISMRCVSLLMELIKKW